MIAVLEAGPLVTLQDDGRPGHMASGLGCGGAADRRALAEARALLGCGGGAAIETAGATLRLRVERATTVALAGAPMVAEADGAPLEWHAAHALPAGTVLSLRPGIGVYAYVMPAGGVDVAPVMGSRSTQLAAGLGRRIAAGDRLPIAGGGPAPRRLAAPEARFGGGLLRCVATPQTALYAVEAVERFTTTPFRRDPRGDRRGVRLASDGPGLAVEDQLTLLSDFVLPGDVQTTGDGVPYILGPDCQTTGGYPRIAHVIAADLPRAMQAPPGAEVRFEMVDLAAARAVQVAPPRTAPLVRDPRRMSDLSSHQLIDGVVDARH